MNNTKQTMIILTGFTPLHHYKFRVKAVNDGGQSDSVETTAITMKQDPGISQKINSR